MWIVVLPVLKKLDITERVKSDRVDSLFSKTHSPPYCCTVRVRGRFTQDLLNVRFLFLLVILDFPTLTEEI